MSRQRLDLHCTHEEVDSIIIQEVNLAEVERIPSTLLQMTPVFVLLACFMRRDSLVVT